MKRYLFASLGAVAFGLAAPASAADLPVAPPVAAPVFSWTGFYIGGHAGWARAELEETLVTAFPPFVAGTTFGDSESGFVAGLQAGFNYQIGQFVLGVEGQISWTDIARSTVTTIGGVTFSDSIELNWVATVAARFGVAFGNALLYAKGGVAFADWSANARDSRFGTVFNRSDTETGWMVGAGIEYGFAPNWSLKVEYNFMSFDLDRDNFTIAGVAGSFDHDLDIHLVKAGVNFRFPVGKAPVAPAPVAARY
jgi:outer membrane immunogenic protein